ncbi:MAG TPA: carboxypeptidase-like regulatory domain-containing protein, partial [Terriglobales bacterium]
LVALVGLGLLISSSKPTMAQDVASLTGVVTDSSGAVVVDADVKLVDTKTNTQYQTRTNSTGSYTFTKVLPGPGYQLSVSKEGFQTQTISGIYVGVNATHTQNAELSVGQATQTVEVNAHASTVSLNTTDATVGNNFDMNLVQNLPVLVRDTPTSLLGYQPGTVALSTGSQTGDDTGTQSRSGSVTGARTDQNNITLDGIDVNDFAGGFGFDALVANAPVDSVQEFRGEVANPLSAEGRGSGAQVTLVTKSGTNGFHGAGYEYYRTRGFQANDFFNNFANPVVPRVPLVRNQFGADLGGPIIKDKLFFFFNYEGRRDARGNPVLRTVPLPSFKQGNIAYLNQSGGVSVLPATAPGTQASVQNFDPLGIGADPALTSFLNQRYPDPNSTAAGDGLNSGGFQFNAPGNQTLNDYVVRLDYNISDTMKVFARGSMVREIDDRDPSIRFPGDPLTFIDTDHSYGFVFGHTWTISSTKVNQFVYGETVQALNFPYLFNPNGTTVYDSFGATGTGGAFLSAPYFTPAAQARKIPIPEYRDDFTYLRGRHTFQVGGTFKPIKTTSFLRSDFNEVPVGLGGGLTGLSGGSTQLQPNDLATDSVSQNLYDSAFAFILGNIPSVDSSYNNDRNLQPLPQGTGHTRQYRYYETEAYLQDSFKARPDLTLTYGLRYQFDSVAYEVNGLEAVPNIGFDQAIAPRIANGAAGVSGFFANPIITYSLGGKVNHGAPLYHPDWHNFQPRLAFAYNPSFSQGILGRVFGDRKTVIRAGAGIVDDHTLVNALNFLQDQNTWILQNSASQTFATDGDPTVNLQNDPRFTATNVVPPGGVQPPPAITTPYSPAFANGNPWGLASFSGLAFNYAIDPNLKTPYSYAVTFGFQRELPSNFQLEMSYDGRFAHRLLAQADAMQVVNFRDPASGTDLVSQFAKLSLAVRNNDPSINDPAAFPFFENVMNPAMLANPNLGVNCETIFGGAFPSCASLLDAASSPLDFRGDMADVLQVLNGVFANSGDVGLIEPGVGLNPQFGSSLYMTNKGYSNYNGLLVTLHHKASHGLQFDLNYTWSHSLDNISAAANNAFGNGAGAGGIMCDAINIRVCYANSDFDVRHNITGDWFYQLPFGRGKTFASTAPVWLDEVIGGWTISGLVNWRTGLAFQTVANAFPISFANNVPAVFNGDTSALEVSPHREINAASGLPTIQLFKNPTKAMNSFTGPLGLQAGSRNNLRGPHYSDFDMGVGKHFPITERVGLTFRADAQNVFNHTNFELPGTDGTADITSPSSFGVITGDYGARVLQLALRLDF